MPNRIAVLLLGAAFATFLAAAPVLSEDAENLIETTETTTEGTAYVPGEVIVRLEDGSYEARPVVADTLGEIEEEAEEIEEEPGVEVAGPNYVYELEQAMDDPSTIAPAPEPEYVPEYVPAASTPNDAFYANGQQPNLEALELGAAWDYSRGAGQRVAVVDTGYYRTHPELKDDVAAERDFVDKDSIANTTDHHGTQVAGIAAGETNNGRGIAAAGWAAKVMVARACTTNGCPSDKTAPAVDWARKNGADVINLSFGDDNQTPPGDPVLGAAIQRTLDADIVVVASTGNGGLHADNHYPAAYPGVLGVGSSVVEDPTTVSVGTNSGSHVDVVAPSEASPYGGIIMPCNPEKSPKSLFCYRIGTSFSAPQVAGIAALVRASDPSLTQAQVVTRIQEQADDIAPAGRDDASGYGEANARCSVRPDLSGC